MFFPLLCQNNFELEQKAIDTETKIKEAARKLFLQKGLNATRVRDIAEEAGINLALLNYYFRSKEKLFELIMTENLGIFFSEMKGLMKTEKPAKEKIREFVSGYVDLLIAQPELPIFILGEIQRNPSNFLNKMGAGQIGKEIRSWKEFSGIKNADGSPINPLHILMNLISLTVFPFVARPMLLAVGGLDNNQFTIMMKERKKLIPLWIEQMLSGYPIPGNL